MAGSHQRGIEHARGDLFEGAPCIVTRGDAWAQQRVCDFWRALGAHVLIRDPAVHDEETAWMSHVPHVLAFAFARALDRAPTGAHQVAGAGFRDFTRIAQSDPVLWGGILTANRKAIAAPLRSVTEALTELGRAIEADDPDALERWIATAREALFSIDSNSVGCEERTSADSTQALMGSPGSPEAKDLSTSNE